MTSQPSNEAERIAAKGHYDHSGVVLQDGHVDHITGPRCMIQMKEGPHNGLYVIGQTAGVLVEGTPVWRNSITGRARAALLKDNPHA